MNEYWTFVGCHWQGKLKRLERNLSNCIVRHRLLLKLGPGGENLALATWVMENRGQRRKIKEGNKKERVRSRVKTEGRKIQEKKWEEMEEWRKEKHKTADGIRPRLSWNFMQRGMVVPYWRFGSIFRGLSVLQEDCFALEDRTDRLSRNVSKEIPLYAAYISHERRSHLHLRGRLT